MNRTSISFSSTIALLLLAACHDDLAPEQPTADSTAGVAVNVDGLRTAAQVRAAAEATYIHGMTDEIADEVVGSTNVGLLHDLLRDPTFHRQDNVVAFLAYLGDESSVDLLREYLVSAPVTAGDPAGIRSVLLVPQVLGQIGSRGHISAIDELMGMTAHNGNGGVLLKASPAVANRYATELFESALRGLAWAGTSDAAERLEAIESGDVVPYSKVSFRDQANMARDIYAELHEGFVPVQRLAGPVSATLPLAVGPNEFGSGRHWCPGATRRRHRVLRA